MALAYPSAYRVGMSSLGFQTVYRLVQGSGIASAARVFLSEEPVGFERGAAELSYETGAPLSSFRLVGFSVAWELDIGPLIGMLSRARVPVLGSERGEGDPIVVVGGPLASSNPRPLAPFCDAIVVGDAECVIGELLAAGFGDGSRLSRLEGLARIGSVWVPSLSGTVPTGAVASDSDLPAWAPIRSPHAEMRDMFLVEAVRGCSRRCQYCIMRGSLSGGMRVVPAERVLSHIPDQVRKVGLVGASVSDHPDIAMIVNTLVEKGCQVGLSSLRPERLTSSLVGALGAGGYKTITTALDGSSQRLRDCIRRGTTAAHLLQAAQLCRDAKINRLKLYVMVGLPGETDSDIDECALFVRELSRLLPVSLGVSAFCAKLGTPLASAEFAGVDVAGARIKRLQRKVGGAAEIRSTSPRWAWVEHVLAVGTEREGLAVLAAVRSGGGFSEYRRAFEKLGHCPNGVGGSRE